MTNFIEKFKKTSEENGLLLNISGSEKSKIFYGKVLQNPHKIISAKNNIKLFISLCAYLVQNKKGDYIRHSDYDYNFIFIDGDFKIEIQRRINGYNIISVYNLNK
jgi:hypothetical protein